MGKALKIGLILLFFCGLVAIRFFDNELFYDPLIAFFKGNYLQAQPSGLSLFKLTGYTVLRYLMNTILSLAIIFVAFRDWSIIKFSAFFYAAALIVLLALFLIFINGLSPDHYLIFFYIRRFLIQPLFVLLLLPAFYYQRHLKGKGMD